MSTTAHTARKNVENTVFVRFQPPTDAIRRHHVEDVFSQIGPIKKSSVIHSHSKAEERQTTTSSYGFVKYTVPEDAEMAAVKLNNHILKLPDGVSVTIKVERAEKDHTAPKRRKDRQSEGGQQQQQDEGDDTVSKKKTNRLIVRNLSFYAKEKDIRKALSIFDGELIEVHIPKVAQTGGHRGFCFVTFDSEKAVKQCLKNSSSIVIKDRAVNIARALHKTAYQSQNPKHEYSKEEKKSAEVKNAVKDDEDETSGSSDSDSDNDDSGSDEESVHDDDNSEQKKNKRSCDSDATAVAEKRCLFLRNLPFDCTRHDVFEAFRQFGYITAIYIVKDKETHSIPKGTAFVSFQKPEQASKALQLASASSSSFITQRSAIVEEQGGEHHEKQNAGGIVLKGRRLLVNLAVDKETATTLSVSEKKQSDTGGQSKDKRNLYLKGEGRVENDEKAGVFAWDDLPETDKVKRQTAWSEKNTKLRSPLFFINPNRLSVRNLAKHVDEAALKELCVRATLRGLENNLVNAEDQIAHWRAGGEMTTREILALIQEATAQDAESAASNSPAAIIPPFDTKNVKQCIPSVHIHRDYVPGGNKKLAPSRGFGFVEFEHHAHAMACLRELNNNTHYSAEFAAGGKHAAEMKRRRNGKKHLEPSNDEKKLNFVGEDGRVRIPRLIVEFTVENKAKAKQQAEHRAQQQANLIKQLEQRKVESEQSGDVLQKKKKKKKSRGAKQRERKRKQLKEETASEEKSEDTPLDDANSRVITELNVKPEKRKVVKPRKKQKIDQGEATFSKLVESYKQQAIAIMGSGAIESSPSTSAKKGKRWFE